MGNVLGVWSASAGLWLCVYGLFGSVRGAAGAAGVLLLLASLALLVEVGGDA